MMVSALTRIQLILTKTPDAQPQVGWALAQQINLNQYKKPNFLH